MKFSPLLVLIFLACDGGSGVIDQRDDLQFSIVEEQVLQTLLALPETTFASHSNDPMGFATSIECQTTNSLFINNEEIKLIKAAFEVTDLGTNFYAVDKELRYAVIASLAEIGNFNSSVADFVLRGGNDIIIYRLRQTGAESFRIISTHGLRNTPATVEVCVSSSGVVISGDDLVFNRIPTLVSLTFRSRQLNQINLE